MEPNISAQYDEMMKYIELANMALQVNNGEEALSYANRAIEIMPTSPYAWYIKMEAVNATATLGDLKVVEVLNYGQKVVELELKEATRLKIQIQELRDLDREYEAVSSEEDLEIWTNEVYAFFLDKILRDLQFCIDNLRKTDDVKKRYELYQSIHSSDASNKALKEDLVFNTILGQVNVLLQLRTQIPEELVASDSHITQLVKEIAEKWIDYTNAVNNRLHIYGTHLNDVAVKQYRIILEQIKQGLPRGDEAPIGEDKISNPPAPTTGPCYIATAVYGSYDSPEVWTLRRYRDYLLRQHLWGRFFVSSYYAFSPTLVRLFGNSRWFKILWKASLDKVVLHLQKKGYSQAPYQD